MTLYDIGWAILEGLGLATLVILLVRWGLKTERKISGRELEDREQPEEGMGRDGYAQRLEEDECTK